MVNYPQPLNNGNSQAYTCVAWRNGRSLDTLVAKAGQQEEILLATFDMDDIRACFVLGVSFALCWRVFSMVISLALMRGYIIRWVLSGGTRRK